MLSSLKNQFKNKLAVLVFTITAIVLYWPVIQNKISVKFDERLKTDIHQVESINDYVRKWKSSEILDFQPVRDASYAIDHIISKAVDYDITGVTSVLLFIIIGSLIFAIYREVRNDESIDYFPLILLLHPVLHKFLILDGLRKYLLAIVFILPVILNYLRNKRNFHKSLKVHILFLFSLLSHPLAIFFPLWVSIRKIIEEKRINLKSVLNFKYFYLISLTIGLINFWWYQSNISMDINQNYHTFIEVISYKLLSIGRHHSFFFIPDFYALYYGIDSLWNVIGIIIALLFPLIAYKFIKKKDFLNWFSFIYIMSLPTIIFSLPSFAGEYYFVFSYIGFLITLEKLISNKKHQLLLMSIVPLLAIQTYRFVSSAKNLESYYEESYSNDSSCGNLIKLSLHHFFISQNYDRAMQTGSDTLKKGCIEKDSNGNYTTNSILARYVALYPKDKNDPKDFEKRLNYLNKMAERSFDFKLARAYILLKTGNKLEAQETIDKSISEPEVQLLSSDLLIIKYLEICKKEKFNWCDEFAKKANSSR